MSLMEARLRAVYVLDDYLAAPPSAPGKGGPVRYMSEEILDRLARAGVELRLAPQVVVEYVDAQPAPPDPTPTHGLDSWDF